MSPAEKTGWGMEEGRLALSLCDCRLGHPLPNGERRVLARGLAGGAENGEFGRDRGAGSPGVQFAASASGPQAVTANHPIPLPDGSTLALTVADITDRLGRTYPNGIDPDVRSRVACRRPPSKPTRAVRDAGAWLESACR